MIRWARWTGLGVVGLLVGCTMVRTTVLDPEAPIGCNSTAGSYSVSKTLLVVTVSQAAGEPAVLDKVETRPIADKNLTYCLDYLSSITSVDEISINKTTGGLLQHVAAKVHDESSFIFRTIIQTVFTALSGAPQFPVAQVPRGLVQPDGAGIKFHAEFDPFDPIEAVRTNKGLSKNGFCLILPGFMFDLTKLSINDYCKDPTRALKSAMPVSKNGQKLSSQNTIVADPDALLNGILYRPRHPYELLAFARTDEFSSDWILIGSGVVHLENISPILSIGINRSLFSRRQAILAFRDGVLERVCLHKSSELLEAADIPFAIAAGIVALPAKILSVRINQAKDEEAIARAETDLLLAQQKHLEILQGSTKSPGTVPPRTQSSTPLAVTDLGTSTGIAPGAGDDPFADNSPFAQFDPFADDTDCAEIADSDQKSPIPRPARQANGE